MNRTLFTWMAGNIKKRIMGSSESKMTASAAIKPEPAFKKTHISHLIDPRSPSAGIERTPIQVGYLVDPFIYLKKKHKVWKKCTVWTPENVQSFFFINEGMNIFTLILRPSDPNSLLYSHFKDFEKLLVWSVWYVQTIEGVRGTNETFHMRLYSIFPRWCGWV